LIRREAIVALDLIGAPRKSMDATKGVYEVCEDDDILDLFRMEEPADAALALVDPVNVMMGKVHNACRAMVSPFLRWSARLCASSLLQRAGYSTNRPVGEDEVLRSVRSPRRRAFRMTGRPAVVPRARSSSATSSHRARSSLIGVHCSSNRS
jgi:hypothetical protein